MERTNKKNLLKNQIKRHSKASLSEEDVIVNKNNLIPTGSTLLDLAMSDTIWGGVKKGTMINIIGASSGGKTILALTSFAETNLLPGYDNYHFIYDDVERANAFNMKKMFGKTTSNRIIPARKEKDEQFSITVQHFHCNFLHWADKKEPFIYVLDSFDALDALEDQKKVEEMVDALEKDKKTAGTYGMAKAKGASGMLRNIVGKLSDTQSALYIISQVRDNVDGFSFEKETRSGGRALKFYAFHEIWLKPIKTLRKKETVIGHTVKAKITKNKITGKEREVEFDIYYDYGIDDIGSCIDYLINMGRWYGGGQKKIDTKGDLQMDPCIRSKLIDIIEEDNLVYDLKKIVKKVWDEFEDSIKLNRKSKYDE